MAELGFLNFGYSMRHKKADFDSFTSTAVDDANATTSSAARTLYTHWNLDLKKTSLKLNWDYQLSKRHESNPSPSPDFSYEYEYISDRQNLGFSIQQILFDDHNFNLFL